MFMEISMKLLLLIEWGKDGGETDAEAVSDCWPWSLIANLCSSATF